MTPLYAVYLLWVLFFASWLLAAFWADRAVARPGGRAEARYLIVTVIGFAMLFARSRHGAPAPLWTLQPGAGWPLAALCAAGFLFCWWARLHLGRLWSGSVTAKADHRVVDTGPYGVVRHPIYTGLIVSCLTTAVLKASAIALLGCAVLILGFWIKARLEERFLREQLGAEAYDAYSRRVAMLIPFGPR